MTGDPSHSSTKADDSEKNICPDGAYVVTANHALWPNRCVICNSTEGAARIRYEFTLIPPIAILASFFFPPIYPLVWWLTQKKGVLHLGICARHRRIRNVLVVQSLIGICASLGAFVLGIILIESNPGKILTASGMFGLLIFIPMFILADRVVSIVKMNEKWIWVSVKDPFWKSLQ